MGTSRAPIAVARGCVANTAGCSGWRFRFVLGARTLDESGKRLQQFLARAQRNIEILEILLGKIGQNIKIDFVFGKKGPVFCQPDLRQPLIYSFSQIMTPPRQF